MRFNKVGSLATLPVVLALCSASVWATPLSGLQPIPAQQQQRPNPPSPAPNEMQPQPNPDQPTTKDQASSSTFTGTIMKDGEQFLLKDSSGTVYKLDDSSRASTFEGKSVKITGKLDADAKLIHVDSIEVMSA